MQLRNRPLLVALIGTFWTFFIICVASIHFLIIYASLSMRKKFWAAEPDQETITRSLFRWALVTIDEWKRPVENFAHKTIWEEKAEMLAWKLSGLGFVYLIGLLVNLALIMGVKMRLPILFLPWLMCNLLAISACVSVCISTIITTFSTSDETLQLNFLWLKWPHLEEVGKQWLLLMVAAPPCGLVCFLIPSWITVLANFLFATALRQPPHQTGSICWPENPREHYEGLMLPSKELHDGLLLPLANEKSQEGLHVTAAEDANGCVDFVTEARGKPDERIRASKNSVCGLQRPSPVLEESEDNDEERQTFFI